MISRLHFRPVEYQYAIAWLYPFNLLVRVHPKRARGLIMSKLLKRDIIHVDISDFLSLKKVAIEEYQSQLKILSHRQRRPMLRGSFLQRFLKNEEEFFVTR